jgi:hypothetical protein
VKNYRVEGPARHTTMTLNTSEFIRRFLIHVLPKGYSQLPTIPRVHRIIRLDFESNLPFDAHFITDGARKHVQQSVR